MSASPVHTSDIVYRQVVQPTNRNQRVDKQHSHNIDLQTAGQT